ncbi:hypothetical protein [Ferruginibacter sp. SUN106]|uniref:hypothetical protein n=1 Tax=Ferruginibacter sp. SUN106 TaxID=2978348 RepID=UPI003D36AEFB
MKHIYPLVLLSTLLIIFSSCAKLNPERKIVGTWKLDDVVKKKFLSGDHLSTGYEGGLFRFENNGNATYTDTVTLTGFWDMRYEDRSYYDGNGDYHNNNNLVLRIKLVNFATNRIIDWVFDDTQFKRSSDRMDGFMYYAFSTYQYSFRRQ